MMNNRLSLYVYCIISLLQHIVSESVCPDGYYEGILSISCYKLSSTGSVTYFDARTDCAADGGYLVSITNEEENKFINDLSERNKWIGLNSLAHGTWKWDSGDEAQYFNWQTSSGGAGELDPDGLDPNSVGADDVNCVSLISATKQWSDRSCTSNAGYWYVCQVPGPPTSQPSASPTSRPTSYPSSAPSYQPTEMPSNHPSSQPATNPTSQPSIFPAAEPSTQPSSHPSMQPSSQPICFPSSQPNSQPSTRPSYQPSTGPSARPISQPSYEPSVSPTSTPSSQPNKRPTTEPSVVPTGKPSNAPYTSLPTLAPSRYTTPYPTLATATPTFTPITLYTSVVIVNSTMSELDQPHSQALSSTLAGCLGIEESDVAITSSRTPNRRLLDLFVVVADTAATFSYHSGSAYNMASSDKGSFGIMNRTDIHSSLKDHFMAYIVSGNATRQFRQELTLLGVNFYPHIAIVATNDGTVTQTTESTPRSVEGLEWMTIGSALAAFGFFVCCGVLFYYYFRYRYKQNNKGDAREDDLDLSSLYENGKGSSDKAGAIEDGESDVLKAVYTDFLESNNYFTSVSNSCMPSVGSFDGIPRPRSIVMDDLDLMSLARIQDEDNEDTNNFLEEGLSSPLSQSDEDGSLSQVGFNSTEERDLGDEELTEDSSHNDASIDLDASSDAPALSEDTILGYDVYDPPSESALIETDDERPDAAEVDSESNKLSLVRPQHASPMDKSFSNPLRSIGGGPRKESKDAVTVQPRGLFPDRPYMSSPSVGSLGSASLKARRPHMNNDQANPLMGGSRTNNQITSSIKFRATKLIFESMINENSKSSHQTCPGSPESSRTVRRQGSNPHSPNHPNNNFMRSQMRRTSTNDSTRTEDFASISIGSSISREQGLSEGLSDVGPSYTIDIDLSDGITDI